MDCVVNIDNFDCNNILTDKFELKDRGSISVYYNTLQKIIVKIPQVKVIYVPTLDDTNTHSRSITVVLCPYTSELKKFCNQIRKIDASVQKKINKKIKSTIFKYNDMKAMYLYMHFDKTKKCFDFPIYNEKGKRTNIRAIHKFSIISAFVELSYVWYKNAPEQNNKTTVFGLHWNIIKAKLHPDINFKKCMFSDCEEEDDNQQQNMFVPNLLMLPLPPPPPTLLPPPPPPPMPLRSQQKSKTAFAPTNSELLDMKSKLKSTQQ